MFCKMAENGMDTLGSRLEEARKRKGVSIREASEATKIRMEYLSQFEGDDFDIPLPAIYQRGFVKIYARYLGEDPEACSAEVKARQNRHQAFSGRSDVRPSFGQMDLKSRRRHSGEPGEGPKAVSVDDGGSPQEKSGWKIPSVRMPSLRSSAQAENEFDDLQETGDSLDRTFYLKVGVIVGLATVVVVLFIALLKVILGGDEKEEETNTDLNSGTNQTEIVGGTDPVAPPVEDTEITIRATGGPTWVQLKSTATDELIGRVSLADGDSRTFQVDGEVLVSFTQGENLEVERGGETFVPTRAGAASFRVQ